MKSIFYLLLITLSISNYSFAQNKEGTSNTSDEQPQFPGGNDAMIKFIIENLEYPEEAINKGIQGKVIVKFKVNSKGKVDSVKIEKGITNCPKCNLEAMRVVESMPNWIPAKENSKNTYLMLPITFALSGTEGDNEGNPNSTKHYDAHWAGFDIGMLMLLSTNFNSNFDNNPYWKNDLNKSVSLNLNLFEYKIPFIKQHLGLTTGLGLAISSIGFNNNYILNHNPDTVFAIKDPIQSYRTNSLTVTYLTAPLLLEFSSKEKQKKSYYLNAGVIGGIRIGSSTTKTGKYENGDRFQTVVRSKYNLAPFTLDATIRAGYGTLGLYASYQLNTLFKENKTVEIYPFKLGITLNVDYFEKQKSKN